MVEQVEPGAGGAAVLVPPLARDRALALASTPEELTDLAAKAEAVRRLLKRSKRKLTEQNEVAVFRLKVLRKLGKLLAETPKNRGAVTSGNREAPTLADMGISKRDSV